MKKKLPPLGTAERNEYHRAKYKEWALRNPGKLAEQRRAYSRRLREKVKARLAELAAAHQWLDNAGTPKGQLTQRIKIATQTPQPK